MLPTASLNANPQSASHKCLISTAKIRQTLRKSKFYAKIFYRLCAKGTRAKPSQRVPDNCREGAALAISVGVSNGENRVRCQKNRKKFCS